MGLSEHLRGGGGCPSKFNKALQEGEGVNKRPKKALHNLWTAPNWLKNHFEHLCMCVCIFVCLCVYVHVCVCWVLIYIWLSQ